VRTGGRSALAGALRAGHRSRVVGSLDPSAIGSEGEVAGTGKTLYERLGGYDAIAAVTNDLLPRLRGDPQLGRFWAHRGEDGVMREQQLLIDYLCASAGGPTYYRGRDMATAHRGMRISESDWSVFLGHAAATLSKLEVPAAEQRDVVAFVESPKKDIVE
jgi:hemoglobin